MGFITFIIIFAVSGICLFCFLVIPMLEDQKSRGNVKNSDALSKNYCFLLKSNSYDTICELKNNKTDGKLKYAFDESSLLISFSHLGAIMGYQLSFIEYDGRTYLNVSQTKLLNPRSNIPLMINTFFVNKLDAIPFNYSEFTKIKNKLSN